MDSKHTRQMDILQDRLHPRILRKSIRLSIYVQILAFSLYSRTPKEDSCKNCWTIINFNFITLLSKNKKRIDFLKFQPSKITKPQW